MKQNINTIGLGPMESVLVNGGDVQEVVQLLQLPHRIDLMHVRLVLLEKHRRRSDHEWEHRGYAKNLRFAEVLEAIPG